MLFQKSRRQVFSRCGPYGADITNSYDFITELEKSGSAVALYQVEEEKIQHFEDKLKQQGTIKTVSGTLQIHQVFVSSFGKIQYGDVDVNVIVVHVGQ